MSLETFARDTSPPMIAKVVAGRSAPLETHHETRLRRVDLLLSPLNDLQQQNARELLEQVQFGATNLFELALKVAECFAASRGHTAANHGDHSSMGVGSRTCQPIGSKVPPEHEKGQGGCHRMVQT